MVLVQDLLSQGDWFSSKHREKQDRGRYKLKFQSVVIWANAGYCKLGLSYKLDGSTPE